MFVFAIAVAVIFGVVMGTREALLAAEDGQSVPDSRFIGLVAGAIFGVGAAIALAVFYGLCWAVWLWVSLAG